MKNALGAPQSLLVLGGASDIALATARALIADRTRRVILAGRSPEALERAAEGLRAPGVTVETLEFDAADVDGHEKVLGEVYAAADIDCTLLAFGTLGDQAHDEAHPVDAARVAHVNYVGAVSAGLVAAAALRRQGHGSLVVLSSVAAERARRSNFVYGSSKAGLDAFAQGLGDALHGSGAQVLVVRPGFVHTKMTAGLPAAPLATTPEAVAEAVQRGLRTGAHTVWAPGALRYVMAGLRHLPRPVFRRLNI
ncbi:decaprenylphospho-beta-D-erythro-pentofuranosid-2-ulose 2-reductase [Actinomadura hibisca]|uniref:decaprenylphospho-beta-D-erythro-pentofuranosid- 2-ulose 2-reductase n=1 Tax=Actinomadura hibisca TaxID=68565 RepID=UPI0008307C4A|nr:decaprenylphospho-beta-D-erythro-pentofuranosid-2-ulose 2-reductase [Actinomadura hibisca]